MHKNKANKVLDTKLDAVSKSLKQSIKNLDSYTHVRGESLYVDDVNIRQGTFHAVVFDSPKAHGKIKNIDYSKAEALEGVERIFTYKDVPGENEIGGIIPDEPLFAEDEVHFWGMPIALIVAESEFIARKARGLIEIEIEDLPVITTAKEAKAKGSFINAPRSFSLGDTEKVFKECTYVFEGETFSNGQEHLYQSVKLILNRHDDLRMTGKRHPYESTYKIGLSKDLKILAYQTEFLQNSGAAADLSPAIAERTLFHATNSYYVPNVTTKVLSCKTNLPPNTAFRGFGGPQGMFVIESAIAKAANEIGVPTRQIQEANLLDENDTFSYGQIAKKVEAKNTWNSAKNIFNSEALEQEVADFNKNNASFKKGLSFMPITFGISFTNTPMNHARALVHIYLDGSVGISTAAVEMGQGVNTKMMQIAADVFSIPIEKIKIETTNTTRVANTSPSAASSTADLNGKATLMACNALVERLKIVASEILNASENDLELKDESVYIKAEKSDLTWTELISSAMLKRVALTENAHYATPEIHFDKTKEKGHPFAYHVYGTAITTTTIDCTRGTYEFDSVKIVHDYGKSMSEGIDLGQVEGALIQGIGWMTMEEIAYNDDGRLLSNALSTYKVPDIFSVPKSVEVIPVETEGNDMAILKSKAVGEPPLMYGIGAYFALQNAIKVFNPNYDLQFHAPMTPEKVLIALYENKHKL